MATQAELTAELAKVNAAIDRITGTTTSGGAQDVSMGGVRVSRADLKVLYDRKKEIELGLARLNSTSGGMAHNPIFGSRT